MPQLNSPEQFQQSLVGITDPRQDGKTEHVTRLDAPVNPASSLQCPAHPRRGAAAQREAGCPLASGTSGEIPPGGHTE